MLHEQSRTTESQSTSCIDGIFHTKDNICKMCGSRHRQAVPKPLLWLQLLFFHLFMVGSCWSFVSLLRLFSLVKAQLIFQTRGDEIFVCSCFRISLCFWLMLKLFRILFSTHMLLDWIHLEHNNNYKNHFIYCIH